MGKDEYAYKLADMPSTSQNGLLLDMMECYKVGRLRDLTELQVKAYYDIIIERGGRIRGISR